MHTVLLVFDIGSSGLKASLMDEDLNILRNVTTTYPTRRRAGGVVEQDAADWWMSAVRAMLMLRELVPEYVKRVDAVGICGHMWGCLPMDRDGQPLQRAMIYSDRRAAKWAETLQERFGSDYFYRETGNMLIAQNTLCKSVWLRHEQPELYEQTYKILQAKDYLVYCLTGVHATDYSDASGMLLLDVEHKCWSRDMLALCGISESQMPRLYESFAPVGTLLPETAAALGLPQGVTVCAGAGDNAAAAVGTGTVSTGAAHADSRCNISLGTSGTIFISSEKFGVDATNGLHAFAHADGGWHLMGCMLSAASCNKWWQDAIIGTNDYKGEEAKIAPEMLGRNHVYFLPYLMGERSPINDTNARAMFVGMTMDTARADMTQAMLEGVAFAIRDSFEVAKGLGLSVPRSNICGGGSRSMLWKRILANVLGIPLDVVKTSEGPGYGAALLAMVACGEYETVAQACSALVRTVDTVEPDASLTALYEERYRQFRQIYPVCRALFPKLL